MKHPVREGGASDGKREGRLSGKKSILEAVQSRLARCIRMRLPLKRTDSHTRIDTVVDVPFVLSTERKKDIIIRPLGGARVVE